MAVGEYAVTQHPFSDTLLQELVFIGYFGNIERNQSQRYIHH